VHERKSADTEPTRIRLSDSSRSPSHKWSRASTWYFGRRRSLLVRQKRQQTADGSIFGQTTARRARPSETLLIDKGTMHAASRWPSPALVVADGWGRRGLREVPGRAFGAGRC
jgi:hypothetical protein